jgi:hypothetical protein
VQAHYDAADIPAGVTASWGDDQFSQKGSIAQVGFAAAPMLTEANLLVVTRMSRLQQFQM